MRLDWSLILFWSTIIEVIHCYCFIVDRGVPAEEQAYIVYAHNAVRKIVAQGKLLGQPKAVNMKRMKWDANLAQAAQRIADTCTYGHSKVHDSRWDVGQNIAKLWSSNSKHEPLWHKFISTWFNEYKKYNYAIDNGAWHYTQIVWADTEYIGCGFTSYKERGNGVGYTQIYVCNYGPGGNYQGEKPYQTGTSHDCDDLC